MAIFGGILIGWFWHKSTVKPVIIEKPGQIVTITEWKTNTVVVQKPIIKQGEKLVLVEKDRPVYVYSLIDTLFTNEYVYSDFFKENGVDSKDLISFTVETKDQIKAYADTTFNKTYLVYKQNLRIRDFTYKPAPIQIKPKQITSKFQLYGSAMLTMVENQSDNVINNKYTFTPHIGVSGIVAERYKIDIGASLNSFYGGIGVKLIDWK